MQHNDYVEAVKEYLRRYREFSQYVINVRKDIEDCETLLNQEPALTSPLLSPTGGCSGGEKVSQQERIYMRREELQEKIAKYQAELQQIEPLVKRLQNSLEALKSMSKTDWCIIKTRYIESGSWDYTAHSVSASVGYCKIRSERILKTLTGMIFGPQKVYVQTSFTFHKDNRQK